MARPSEHTTRREGRSRLRRVVAWGFGTLVLLLALGVLAAIIGRNLWRSEPAYWTTNQAFTAGTDPQTLTDIADRAFNRILSELSNSSGYRPDAAGADIDPGLGIRTIRLGFEEANAWLTTRLDDWLANQDRRMPAGVSRPMLAGNGDSLVAAFRFKNNEIDQVFSVDLSMRFLKDGRATLSVDGVRGGRLPLPTRAVLDRVPGLGDGDERRSRTVAVLLGQEPFDPILPIDGTRQGRIIGMQVDDGGVALVVRAEPTD